MIALINIFEKYKHSDNSNAKYIKFIITAIDFDSLQKNILFKYAIKNIHFTNISLLFTKLRDFINSRKKFMVNDTCDVCYEQCDLYPYDCMNHKFCIYCYNKMRVCPLCKIPKNPYFNNLGDLKIKNCL
jgi:hypothetical protein